MKTALPGNGLPYPSIDSDTVLRFAYLGRPFMRAWPGFGSVSVRIQNRPANQWYLTVLSYHDPLTCIMYDLICKLNIFTTQNMALKSDNFVAGGERRLFFGSVYNVIWGPL